LAGSGTTAALFGEDPLDELLLEKLLLDELPLELEELLEPDPLELDVPELDAELLLPPELDEVELLLALAPIGGLPDVAPPPDPPQPASTAAISTALET
jgi:hypothetical protein